MNRYNIRLRLIAGFGLLLVLMVGMVAVALWASHETSDRSRVLFQERTRPLQALSDMNYLNQRNQVLVMDMLLNPGSDNVEKRTREFADNALSIEQRWSELRLVAESPTEQPLWTRLQTAQSTYFQDGLKPANDAMASNRYDDAQEVYLLKISPLGLPVQQAMNELLTLKVEQAQSEYKAAERITQLIGWALPVAAAIALVVGAVLALAITRSINEPLGLAVLTMNAVAKGSLDSVVQVRGQDELAELLGALRRMQNSLLGIVQQVRLGSTSVTQSAQEIASGSNDLSRRTEQQAAHLEETTASVTELSAQADRTATIAARAAGLARQVSAHATDSATVMQEASQTMENIRSSSARIADITGMIDSLAFQTNILALNAAVEAARAGEQGRGFAVVAAEVRHLAQRSATAAGEIRVLIEESVTRTQRGTALVRHAGDGVNGIQAQVATLAELIGQLSQSGGEQSTALQQIRQALGQLDDTTQHNAALVEESAAAAQSLREQAVALERTVGFFSLSGDLDRELASRPLLPAA